MKSQKLFPLYKMENQSSKYVRYFFNIISTYNSCKNIWKTTTVLNQDMALCSVNRHCMVFIFMFSFV